MATTTFEKPMGSEVETLKGQIGTLSSLTTSAKSSAVAAINEVNSNKANKPIVIEVTGTTTSSGALLIPTVIVNGTFLSAWGKTGNAYFIFRRDPSYFVVRDINLNVVSETEVTINVAYIPG